MSGNFLLAISGNSEYADFSGDICRSGGIHTFYDSVESRHRCRLADGANEGFRTCQDVAMLLNRRRVVLMRSHVE